MKDMFFWTAIFIIPAILAVVFIITSGKNPPLFSDTTDCPDCEKGKIWSQAHDSSDLELANCTRCGGTGEISLRDPEDLK